MSASMSRRDFLMGSVAALSYAAYPGTALAQVGRYAQLSRGLNGRLIFPHERGYGRARKVYNGRFNEFPAAIVLCVGSDDVRRALEFARSNALEVAVRSGGHDYAGYSTCNGGLVIDLGHMNHINLNRDAGTATVEMGAKIGHLYHELGRDGFTAPAGTCPSVGLGGLALGGGIGPFVCKYGLTCDNIVSAEVVLADGSIVHASSSEHPDLFWAIRGGGANLGIVTKVELRAFPIHRVLYGMVNYPQAQHRDVLRFYRNFLLSAPDELTTSLEIDTSAGQALLSVSVCYTGNFNEGARVVAPLMNFGTPSSLGLSAASPPQLLDKPGGSGTPRMQTGAFFPDLSDDLIDTICDAIAAAPDGAEIGLDDLRGASMTGDGAFPLRSRGLSSEIAAAWTPGGNGDAAIAWVNDTLRAVSPFADGVYVNRLHEEGQARAREAYGASYDRLATIKAEYDPANFFHRNQNIRHSAARRGQIRAAGSGTVLSRAST